MGDRGRYRAYRKKATVGTMIIPANPTTIPAIAAFSFLEDPFSMLMNIM